MRRFISSLAELPEPFHNLLKKNVPFKWSKKQLLESHGLPTLTSDYDLTC